MSRLRPIDPKHLRRSVLFRTWQLQLYYKENLLQPYDNGYLELQSIKITSDFGVLDLVNVYNPCKNITYEEFKHYVSQLEKSHILVGDFNAHSPLWNVNGKRNHTGESLEALVEELDLGVLLCGEHSTYLDRKAGTESSLDLCITTSDLYTIGEVIIGPDLGSDHLPIQCNFELNVVKDKMTKPSKWLLNGVDWKLWTEKIAENYKNLSQTYPETLDNLQERFVETIGQSVIAFVK